MRLPRTCLVLPAFLLALVATPAQAQVTWISNASGNWNTPSNWSTNQVPQAGEDVIIDRPGSITVTVNVVTAALASLTAAENLVVSSTLTVDGDAFFDGGLALSGTLAGTGTYQLRSSGTWSSGTLGANVTIAAGQTLTISGSPKALTGATLQNFGTVLFTGGSILVNGNAGVVNAVGALWDVQGALTITTSAVGTQSFTNAGTFRRSGATGTASVTGSVAFVNTGTIEAQIGALTFQGPSTTTSGAMAIAAGATVTLAGAATLQSGATFPGSGTLAITGTTTVAAAVSVAAPSTLTGTLTGPGTLTLNAPMTWSNGTLGANVTVAAGQTLTISTAPKALTGATLQNFGTVLFTGGSILVNGNAGVVNAVGALWDVQGAQTITTSAVGTQSFTNAGTFRRSGATGTASVTGSVAFVNTGTIEAQIGTLTFQGPSTTTSGAMAIAADATVTLAGAATLQLGATFTGSGTLAITGTTTVAAAVSVAAPSTLTGTLTGPGTLTLNAPMTWSSGTLGANVTVAAGQTLTISSAPKNLTGATLQNFGTVLFTGGSILVNGNAGVVNAVGALWDVQGALTITTSVVGTQSFTNAGTFRRSGATGAATVTGSVAFVNTGSVEALIGALTFQGPNTTTSGAMAIAADATVTLAGAATLQSGATFTGSGTLAITGTTTVAAAVSVAVPSTLTGTLTGAGTLTLNAPMTWSSGTLGANVTVAAEQTLTISGAPKNLTGATLQNLGTVRFTGGSILVNGNAGVVNAVGALWDVQGALTITTSVAGTQSFANAGTLRKSGATGTFSISGSVQFTNTGTIELRLGGTSAGQFDVLALSQPFTFDGTLDISPTGGFEPRFFHAFNVVTYPSRTNTFTSIDGNGDTYIDQYQTTALRLRPLADPLENLIRNGTLDTDLTNWLTFATPNSTYLSTSISGGVLNFYREPPPPGTSNQATVYQETQAYLPADTTLSASFNLANTSSVRKRISVLMLDSDFSDLAVCTFFLEPGAPMRTYMMRTQAGKIWDNAALYFYAASAGANGGAYQLDNVSMHYDTALPGDRTTCHDATVPTAPGGTAGPNLLSNGDFGTGTLAPWGLFGQIQSQIANGVFEFIKLAGTPAGVVLQNTGQPMTPGQILTSTFQLGNSSGVRKRVTVIVHDNNFSDLSACTFWLDPGQPLATYTYRTFATQAWTNATVSVYPATTGAPQWIRLDNVTFQRTPGTATVGTECIEPVGGADQRVAGTSSDEREGGTLPGLMLAGGGVDATSSGGDLPSAVEAWLSHWIVDGFLPVGDWLMGPSWTTTASDTRLRTVRPLERLDLTHAVSAAVRFSSTLRADAGSTAFVQVSHNGVTWETVHVVAPSAATTVDVDLDAYRGTAVFVRFAFEGVAPDAGGAADTWRVDDIGLDVVVALQARRR